MDGPGIQNEEHLWFPERKKNGGGSAYVLQERLFQRGVSALTDAELLLVLFHRQGTETRLQTFVQRLAGQTGGLRALVLQDPLQLRRLPGLGVGAAAQILAAVELTRRIQHATDQRPRLKTAGEIYEYLVPQLSLLRREVFHVLCFNPRNTLLANIRVAEGTVDACPVDPREVFAPALGCRASAMVLVHNHPSGDPEPSTNDVALTAQLVEAGRVLGIRVLDHVVFADGGYTSLLEQGRMPCATGRPRAGSWNTT
jgi:DNA repair protein RadC